MPHKPLLVICKCLLCITIVVFISAAAEAQGVMAAVVPNGFRVVIDTRGLSPQFAIAASLEITCRDSQGYLLKIPLDCRPPVRAGGIWEKIIPRPISCIEFLGFGMSSLDPLMGKWDSDAPSWSGPVKPIR